MTTDKTPHTGLSMPNCTKIPHDPQAPRHEAVTTVTRGAGIADEDDDLNYGEILEEVMDGRSTREFADLAGGDYSHAAWSKYKADPSLLPRKGRNLFRRMVGFPELPPLPAEAAAEADDNAEVRRTGTARPNAIWLWNIQEAGNNPFGEAVTVVTGDAGVRRRKVVSFWHELPVKTLAQCIRDRVEL